MPNERTKAPFDPKKIASHLTFSFLTDCCNNAQQGHGHGGGQLQDGGCFWSRPHQRPTSLQCNMCCHHPNSSRAMSPSSCSMALQPAFADEKLKELETDKESLKLQVTKLFSKDHAKAFIYSVEMSVFPDYQTS